MNERQLTAFDKILMNANFKEPTLTADQEKVQAEKEKWEAGRLELFQQASSPLTDDEWKEAQSLILRYAMWSTRLIADYATSPHHLHPADQKYLIEDGLLEKHPEYGWYRLTAWGCKYAKYLHGTLN